MLLFFSEIYRKKMLQQEGVKILVSMESKSF